MPRVIGGIRAAGGGLRSFAFQTVLPPPHCSAWNHDSGVWMSPGESKAVYTSDLLFPCLEVPETLETVSLEPGSSPSH